MTDLPPGITYGHVVGQIILAVADSPDLGPMPDAKAAQGTVTFTPKAKTIKVTTTAPATVLPQAITCSLDENGHLIDEQGAAGVWLITGAYAVAYRFTHATLPSHDIEVTPEHTEEAPLDLTLAIPPGGAPVTTSQYAELSARIDTLEVGAAPETPWTPVPLLNGWAGSAHVRRFGPVVSLTVQGLNGAAASGANVLDLPLGYWPARAAPVFARSHKTGATGGPANAELSLIGGGANQTLRASVPAEWTNGSATLTFFTDDPMPA